MYALAWQYNRSVISLVANVGLTVPGKPAKEESCHIPMDNDEVKITSKPVPRPKMVEDFFNEFSAIEIHNTLRKNNLRWEDAWNTKSRIHRIFSTVYGIIITDAYKLYVMKRKSHHLSILSYIDFIERIALDLIHNSYLEPKTLLSISSSNNNEYYPQHQQHYQFPYRDIHTSTTVTDGGHKHFHQLCPLRNIPSYQEKGRNKGPSFRAKRRCKFCHKATPWYCLECSDLSDPNNMKLVCLCTITLGSCFMKYHGY
jgi:hypothetical protein